MKWLARIPFALMLVVFPLLAGDFYVNLASQILIAAIFAASLNLLVGYGGLVSLGHAAWVGLAAYTSAWLYLRMGLGHSATAPLALLLTTVIAGIFGWSLDAGAHSLSLTYTPSAVPEPSALALLAGAAGGWFIRRRFFSVFFDAAMWPA